MSLPTPLRTRPTSPVPASEIRRRRFVLGVEAGKVDSVHKDPRTIPDRSLLLPAAADSHPYSTRPNIYNSRDYFDGPRGSAYMNATTHLQDANPNSYLPISPPSGQERVYEHSFNGQSRPDIDRKSTMPRLSRQRLSDPYNTLTSCTPPLTGENSDDDDYIMSIRQKLERKEPRDIDQASSERPTRDRRKYSPMRVARETPGARATFGPPSGHEQTRFPAFLNSDPWRNGAKRDGDRGKRQDEDHDRKCARDFVRDNRFS